MDNPVESLIARAESYAAQSGLAVSTVSRLIFNDGKRIGELKSRRASVTHRRLEKAAAALDELEKSKAPAA